MSEWAAIISTKDYHCSILLGIRSDSASGTRSSEALFVSICLKTTIIEKPIPSPCQSVAASRKIGRISTPKLFRLSNWSLPIGKGEEATEYVEEKLYRAYAKGQTPGKHPPLNEVN
jgi:hypothetical protein